MVVKVRSLQRGLHLLQALNMQNGVDSTTLASMTNLSRGTTYRMLETLVDEGFVRKDVETGTYWLEAQTRTLSDGFSQESWLVKIAQPKLDDYSRQVTWPLSLTMPSQTDMVVCARTDHISPLKFKSIPVGHRLKMLQFAAGIVYLAVIPIEQSRLLIDLASRSKPATDSPYIGFGDHAEKTLKTIKRQGYFLAESMPKVCALAVPVYFNESAVACISLRIFESAMNKAQMKLKYLDSLTALANEIGVTATSNEDSAGEFTLPQVPCDAHAV